MDSFDEWRRRLADAMERRGDWPARAPWVREAVGAVPRDQFVPERVWSWDGYAYVPVDRAVDPEQWAAEVYGDPDAAVVTQVTDGLPSSSLSCEAVVVDMLDSLLLEPGHRVMELGTGTGRNAALLAWRAGAGRVTSVEVDAELAACARIRLREAGADIRVEVADGRDVPPTASLAYCELLLPMSRRVPVSAVPAAGAPVAALFGGPGQVRTAARSRTQLSHGKERAGLRPGTGRRAWSPWAVSRDRPSIMRTSIRRRRTRPRRGSDR